MNQYIVQDINLLSNVKKFTERNVRMIVILLINFYFKYNQVKLHSESHDIIMFQTLFELL